MKKIMMASVVALMAMSSTAYAGGLNLPVLTNIGVQTGNINVLNGLAIGNNNTVLSGIGNVNVGGVLNGSTLLNGVKTTFGIFGVKKGH